MTLVQYDCKVYKRAVVLSWLGLTESDQAETWWVETWRCIYFPRESSGKIQGERAGLGGSDSRLSSAAESRAIWGKLLYFLEEK